MKLMIIYTIWKFSFPNAKCQVLSQQKYCDRTNITHIQCVNQMNCVRANVLQCGITKKKINNNNDSLHTHLCELMGHEKKNKHTALQPTDGHRKKESSKWQKRSFKNLKWFWRMCKIGIPVYKKQRKWHIPFLCRMMEIVDGDGFVIKWFPFFIPHSFAHAISPKNHKNKNSNLMEGH